MSISWEICLWKSGFYTRTSRIWQKSRKLTSFQHLLTLTDFALWWSWWWSYRQDCHYTKEFYIIYFNSISALPITSYWDCKSKYLKNTRCTACAWRSGEPRRWRKRSGGRSPVTLLLVPQWHNGRGVSLLSARSRVQCPPGLPAWLVSYWMVAWVSHLPLPMPDSPNPGLWISCVISTEVGWFPRT